MPFDRKEYLRNYQREWVQRRRREWFFGKYCIRCGSTESLELDHRDPASKEQPTHHLIWSWREDRRVAELAKCQVLCHACHKAKSNAENLMRIAPATLKYGRPANVYRKGRARTVARAKHGLRNYWTGCRCEVCRAAVRAMREQL